MCTMACSSWENLLRCNVASPWLHELPLVVGQIFCLTAPHWHRHATGGGCEFMKYLHSILGIGPRILLVELLTDANSNSMATILWHMAMTFLHCNATHVLLDDFIAIWSSVNDWHFLQSPAVQNGLHYEQWTILTVSVLTCVCICSTSETYEPFPDQITWCCDIVKCMGYVTFPIIGSYLHFKRGMLYTLSCYPIQLHCSTMHMNM